MKIKKIAESFREEIIRSNGGSEDMCFVVAAPLASYLCFCGFDCSLTEGTVNGHHHFWITLAEGGNILDPTADQFQTPTGEKMPCVFFGKRPSWYRENNLKKDLTAFRN